mmetsp:Transcript_19633/g.29813  ORF Transcript_19633/g.29813 Transcript_19633/m.29813 type:complete len:135 (-) Transcript_19633:3-407(-)
MKSLSLSLPANPKFRNFLTLEETKQMQTSGLEGCRETVTTFLEEKASNLTFEFLTSFKTSLLISGPWSSILSLFFPDSFALARFHRMEGENLRGIICAIPVNPAIDIVNLLVNTTGADLQECIGGIFRLSDFPI